MRWRMEQSRRAWRFNLLTWGVWLRRGFCQGGTGMRICKCLFAGLVAVAVVVCYWILALSFVDDEILHTFIRYVIKRNGLDSIVFTEKLKSCLDRYAADPRYVASATSSKGPQLPVDTCGNVLPIPDPSDEEPPEEFGENYVEVYNWAVALQYPKQGCTSEVLDKRITIDADREGGLTNIVWDDFYGWWLWAYLNNRMISFRGCGQRYGPWENLFEFASSCPISLQFEGLKMGRVNGHYHKQFGASKAATIPMHYATPYLRKVHARLHLRPSRKVLDRAESLRKASGLECGVKYVGVHLRGGDKFIETKLFETESYFEIVLKITRESGIKNVFAMSDSVIHLQRIQTLGNMHGLNIFWDRTTREDTNQGRDEQAFVSLDEAERADRGVSFVANALIVAEAEFFLGMAASNVFSFINAYRSFPLNTSISIHEKDYIMNNLDFSYR